jgi:serine protease Do
MEDRQLPKNEFVREQIKEKPKNRKRTCKHLATAAASGVFFAAAASLVFFLTIPVLERRWQQEETPQLQEDTQLLTTSESSQESSQMIVDTQTDSEYQLMTLEDYQRIQTELYAIGNKANKSIVTITSVVSDTDWFNNPYELEGQGTGTIIGEQGDHLLILTEKKVIKDASEINITFIDNAIAAAELLKYDGNTGLAVLTVSKTELEESTLSAIRVMDRADANSVHKGSIVIALGSPLGANYSILTGSITASNNEISIEDNNYTVYTTDIVSNKNSSGILINTDGQMIGVVLQSFSTDSSGTLTAVAISELEQILNLLSDNRSIPYLGIHGSTVTEQIAKKYDIPKGVYVKDVTMDAPAMSAGLQSGDIIQSLAGQEVLSVSDFHQKLLELSVEETYPVVIQREGTNGYHKITCNIQVGVLK